MPKKQKRFQQPRKPKYKTLAEGFAAAAADEQKKIDMQNEIAKTLRGEKR